MLSSAVSAVQLEQFNTESRMDIDLSSTTNHRIRWILAWPAGHGKFTHRWFHFLNPTESAV